jgi:FkbM family methyltransferase
VYAVEPEPNAIKSLKENIRVSGVKNVEVLDIAFSDEEGDMTLYYFKEGDPNRANASLYWDTGQKEREVVTVKVKRLDQVFSDLTRLDFLKIDVIGYDLKVIKGALGTITRFMPLIMFRYNKHHWDDTNSRLEDAVIILNELGYKVFQLEDGELSEYFTSESCKMVAVPAGQEELKRLALAVKLAT